MTSPTVKIKCVMSLSKAVTRTGPVADQSQTRPADEKNWDA